tara:strand:- start:1951 stop:2091 length:141 start_codon:yes stop_codon:yes gene_type:complete
MPGVTLPDGVATGANTIIRDKKYSSWSLYVGDDARKLMPRNNSKLI